RYSNVQLYPYTTLFRSYSPMLGGFRPGSSGVASAPRLTAPVRRLDLIPGIILELAGAFSLSTLKFLSVWLFPPAARTLTSNGIGDRKSTRLNSSHQIIS